MPTRLTDIEKAVLADRNLVPWKRSNVVLLPEDTEDRKTAVKMNCK